MTDIKNKTEDDGNSGKSNSGNQNSGNQNSGDRNSGHFNSGDRNSGHYNSGLLNSGNQNSGLLNSGNQNSGHVNSGNQNSGHVNSGNFNSGDYNAGWFNTDEPKMRLFNKDSELTYSQFQKQCELIYPDLKVCSWVNTKDMTKQEKKEEIGWKLSGGYLKKLGYKEAWQEYWNRASDSDKKFFTSLPNFDADIFFEITSINTKEKNI